jgi:hypothetical protein
MTTFGWDEMIDWWDEKLVDDQPLRTVAGQVIYTRAYHRPLSWYFRTLRDAGLVVAEIPLHCVIEVWKVRWL